MARKILAQARAELDSAVAALPDIDGDETMAPPHLFQLLVRAVKARQHLTQLETLPEYLT